MSRRIGFVLGLALIATACTGSATTEEVASLESSDTTVAASDASPDGDDEALLAFAACMRDNGVNDFQDPIVDADGKVEFLDKASGKDDEAFQNAFTACGALLEGTALGAGKGPDPEVDALDDLYAFAVCMREQGFDMSDPDPSTGDIGDLDKDDPTFATAYEVCGSVFGTDKDQ